MRTDRKGNQLKVKKHKKKKQKGDQVPKTDPKRKRATLFDVTKVWQIAKTSINEVHAAVNKLSDEVSRAVKDLWTNQQHLSIGVSSAEFNLRAHQMVLNSIVADLGHLKDSFKWLRVVEVNSVMRIDWAHYHKEAADEIKKITEFEMQELRKQEISDSCDKLRKESTKDTLEGLATRIEKGENILKDRNMKEIELNSEERETVAAILRMCSLKEEKGKIIGKKEEVAQEPPPEVQSPYPEGATIFGG